MDLEALERRALDELEDIIKELAPRPPLLLGMFKYSEDQPRDENGRWTSGGGSSSEPTADISHMAGGPWPAAGDTSAWGSNQPVTPGTTPRGIMESVLAPETLARVDHIAEQNSVYKEQATNLAYEHGTEGLPPGMYSVERAAEIAPIINQMYDEAQSVPKEYQAVLMGGLPGAGKTTFLGTEEGSALGLTSDQFFTVNADDMKAALSEAGLVPTYDHLQDSESTGLIHEESSDMADVLTQALIADGTNVIEDYTMSSESSALARIEELRDAGYTPENGGGVTAVFVDTTPTESLARAEYRYTAPDENGNPTYSGRYAYFPGIAATEVNSEGYTTNRQAFEAIKSELDGWVLVDHHTLGSPRIQERS